MNVDMRDQLKQKKQAYVQDEILSSAATLFAEKGFRAITITDIAARLGYTKSVVYYYFKNKNEILWQIFNRMYEKYQATIDEIQSQDLPADEALRRILHSHALHVMKQKDWTAIYFRDESELEPDQQVLMRKRKREYDAKIEVVYQRGILEKTFKDVPPHIAISGFMGMCNWLHTWFNEQGSHTPEQIADYYCDLMSGGYLQ
ncbi:TetR/AcrR family transcriptional regulator|uniref:HTH-type transcriptional repressor KstR2 n=1 Tax=Pseudomonas fluorescens TaxID=294 RepID=A0A5E7HZ94_PSEFL|nr:MULTISPECIES: TetR/AcrR family transcriptional regulator [Pseudomonas]NYU05650.1 TetR/AcrR family transcriptional regulator [Pseudomonas sp. SbOxS1]VVO67637.1 HTH-type transcriptional repressor KstR2 [Pseudomonas fluorescens]